MLASSPVSSLNHIRAIMGIPRRFNLSGKCSSGRLDALASRLELLPQQLRLASSIGIETAERLKNATEVAIRNGEDVVWSGWPRWNEILATCSLICQVGRPAEFGVRSAKQLALYLSKLRSSNSILEFFRWHSSSYRGELTSNKDNVFRFLRACEYGLPQFVALIELFAKHVVDDIDYSLFAAELPRWFRPEILKNLDEQGIPMQISERFLHKRRHSPVPIGTSCSCSARQRG